MALLTSFWAPVSASNSVTVKMIGDQPMTKIKIDGEGEDKAGAFGIGGGLEYQKLIEPHWSVGLEVDWVNRSKLASTDLFPGITTTISGDTKTLLFSSRLIMSQNRKFSPYFGIGFGFALVRQTMTMKLPPGYVWSLSGTNEDRTIIDSAEPTIAWATRVGFTSALTQNVSIGTELGFLGTGNTTHSATAAGQNTLGAFSIKGNQADFILGLNLIYHFGRGSGGSGF